MSLPRPDPILDPRRVVVLTRQALLALLAGGLGYLAVVALARGSGATPLPGAAPPTAASSAASLDGQPATVPRTAERLIADGEYVYGPLLAGFDTAAEVEGRGGSLARYSELVGDERLSGAEVVEQVAREHSVSPKLLLALLDLSTGAVSGAGGRADLGQPFDGALTARGLNASLRVATAWLDDGYYGLKYRDNRSVHFADGAVQTGPVAAGPGHFAVARVLALAATPADWADIRARFADTYRALWGDIPAAVAGPAPPPPVQPPLLLPWPAGERWYYTGGPHGAWGVATAWGAVDFAPPSPVGCGAAPERAVAAAPGLVTRSERGTVVLDLDGDGFEGSGWVLTYLHMATPGRVPAGTRLGAGEPVGHPSCEGGVSTGAHLHLARRYNGEWLPADGGPAPLELSGWRFQGGTREYDGAMSAAGEETRNAVTSGRGGRADLVSDNGPERHAALAEAWRALTVPGVDHLALHTLTAGAEPAAAATGIAPPSAPAAEAPPAVALAPTAAVPATRAAAPGAEPAGHGQVIVNLTLPQRRSQATPFGLEIQGVAGQSVSVLGHVDESGRGEALTLPELPSGPYAVTIRVPGYRAQTLYEVPLGEEPVVLDLTATLTPLQAGELTGDGAIDARDGLAWLALAARRRAAADVTGDGHVGLADLATVLGGWRR